MRVLALHILLAGACVNVGAVEALPGEDEIEPFLALAQPVLEARCANASCHGNAERPLSTYAVHRYRLDDLDTFVDAPLTDEELRLNHLRAAAFTLGVDDAQESLLLALPLHGHAGVDVFTEPEEYDATRLRTWIEGTLAARAEAPPASAQSSSLADRRGHGD